MRAVQLLHDVGVYHTHSGSWVTLKDGDVVVILTGPTVVDAGGIIEWEVLDKHGTMYRLRVVRELGPTWIDHHTTTLPHTMTYRAVITTTTVWARDTHTKNKTVKFPEGSVLVVLDGPTSRTHMGAWAQTLIYYELLDCHGTVVEVYYPDEPEYHNWFDNATRPLP